MIKKIIVTVFVMISSLAWAADKKSTIEPVDTAAMISAFSDFPKGVQQIIVDYYGKYWVTDFHRLDVTKYAFGPTHGYPNAPIYNPAALYPVSICDLEFIPGSYKAGIDVELHLAALKKGETVEEHHPLMLWH